MHSPSSAVAHRTFQIAFANVAKVRSTGQKRGAARCLVVINVAVVSPGTANASTK